MRAGLKFRYLRIIILRHIKHWPVKKIAEYLFIRHRKLTPDKKPRGYSKSNIWCILREPSLQPYIWSLKALSSYERRCRFKLMVKKMELGKYAKPKTKPKRRPQFKKLSSFLRYIVRIQPTEGGTAISDEKNCISLVKKIVGVK